MIRWKRSWPDLSESMPMDFMPCSNGEFIPEPATEAQRAIMRLQNEEGERIRRKLGMTRRDFVRSAAAYSVGLWAIQQFVSGRFGAPAGAKHTTGASCESQLQYNPSVQLANLPGEFIFDLQTHHVDEDGLWRVNNPGFAVFFAAVWSQSGCGDPDRLSCLGRYHYIKEIYLDSSTTAGVLSAVPSSADRNPLPTAEAAETARLINEWSNSQRTVLHAFVMPNRGYAGTLIPGRGGKSLFLDEELAAMTAAKEQYGDVLRAWKCYTPWGDVPNASGWFHDDPNGRAMIAHALRPEVNIPLICTHKGFALPSFDQRSAACRDIGIVGRDYPAMNFIVYHSGFDSETQRAYPGDPNVDSAATRAVDGLIKSLRENGWSARHFAPGGTVGVAGGAGDSPDPAAHGNVPNVYGEIGSTWRSVVGRFTTMPDGTRQRIQAAHLLGKLIYYVGPRRVVWGTDSLWYGTPQPEIVKLRDFPARNPITGAIVETEVQRILAQEYHLPHGLDGDRFDPSRNALDPASYPTSGTDPAWPADGKAHPERTIRNGIFGRNAAEPYGVDPEPLRGKISCSQLDTLRRDLLQNPGTPQETHPLASNVMYGYRTRRELFANIWPNKPWAP